jgi:hypothetical protein
MTRQTMIHFSVDHMMRPSMFNTILHPMNILPQSVKRLFHGKDFGDDSCFHLTWFPFICFGLLISDRSQTYCVKSGTELRGKWDMR